MFRRLDCLRRRQRLYSSLNVPNSVFGRESFACRHIGPNDVEQNQMLKEVGYQVRAYVETIDVNSNFKWYKIINKII